MSEEDTALCETPMNVSDLKLQCQVQYITTRHNRLHIEQIYPVAM